MRPHKAVTQPSKPRPAGVRAFFERITTGTPRSEATAQPARIYSPVNDTRDLDQRVREIGEW